MSPDALFDNRVVDKVPVTKKDLDERREKENLQDINALTTRFTVALGTKFDQKNIPFDIKGFKSNLTKAIEQVLSNPQIPDTAKEKFKQDLMGKIDLLAKIELSDIESLQTRRAIESLGVEPKELQQKFGNDEGKKKAFFLNKILEETIGKYIEPTANGLVVAFSDERKQVGSTEYHGKTLDTFQSGLSALDAKYGINMTSEVEKIAKNLKRDSRGDIAKKDLYRDICLKLVDELNKNKRIPDTNRIKDLINNSKLTDRAKFGKQTEAMTKNGPKDIVDIVLEYKQAIQTFQGTEREVRETRTDSIANNALTKAKQGLGMEGLKSEFDYIKPANIEAKMKEKSLADMVIIGTQLAQLAPIFGDIGGGLDGLVSAYSGMNVEGAKLTGLEKSLNAIFGVLGITVIGGLASRAHKAGKMKELLQSFSALGKYLPEKMAAFKNSGGVIPESVQKTFEKLFPAMKPAYFVPERKVGQNAMNEARVAKPTEEMRLKEKLVSIREELEKALIEEKIALKELNNLREKYAKLLGNDKRLRNPITMALRDSVENGQVIDLIPATRNLLERAEERAAIASNKVFSLKHHKLDATEKALDKVKKATSEGLDIVSDGRNKPKNKIKNTEVKTGVSEETVRRNANLSSSERIVEAEKILKESGLLKQGETLTEADKKLILAGHNAASDTAVYEHEFSTIREKAKASRGLRKEWKKKLMDYGIMGVDKIPAKPATLEELKKVDGLLANKLEAFLSPERKLNFMDGAKNPKMGTTGDEWAEKIISSTIAPLEAARDKISPEFYKSIQEKVYGNLSRQLEQNIIFRLNGHAELIKDFNIQECFEKLALKGFPIQSEAFTKGNVGWKGKEILDTLLSRSRLSSASFLSKENTGAIIKDYSGERSRLLTQLKSKDITGEALQTIKGSLKTQLESIQSKLEDLRKLQAELKPSAENSTHEKQAIKNISEAIKALESESKSIIDFSKSTDITIAEKVIDGRNAEKLSQKTQQEREVLSRAMNREFPSMLPEDKARILLSEMSFDLSAENADRFFNLSFYELHRDIQKQFTTEVMARFGRDADGRLTQESLNLGVQHYGPRILNQNHSTAHVQ